MTARCRSSAPAARAARLAVYPLCGNVHAQGILRLTRAPYGPRALAARGRRATCARVLAHFRYTGILTIEFFVRGGRLIANEMAPRVHNSGHWTIEGAVTSQFENHLRAILGLPLGSTRALGHSAMVNLIGAMPAAQRTAELARPAPARLWQAAPAGSQGRPLHPGRGVRGPPRRPGADNCSRIWPPAWASRNIGCEPTRMYLEPFKLKELPFRLSPDPQFLYLSKQHARAKAYMESTIWFTDGFVVITGEIGSGKTTLIESFLKEVPADVVVAQINQTQVSAIDFLQAVLVQFGFSPFKMRKAELIATLNNFLIEQYAAGRRVLLIVDEAQNLTHARAGGDPPALGGRDHQGEGAAHHPRRAARAQRQARRAGARAADAARAAALSPADALGERDARLHPASPGGRRRRRP